jgi:hypothetical protein
LNTSEFSENIPPTVSEIVMEICEETMCKLREL